MWCATGFIKNHGFWRPAKLRELDACCAALDVSLTYSHANGHWYFKFEDEHECCIDRVVSLVFGKVVTEAAHKGNAEITKDGDLLFSSPPTGKPRT